METYNNDDFHSKLVKTLIKYGNINPGQKVLDIATDTGLVAIEAAKIVGQTGKVIGVDISTGLLEVAQKKITAANLTNIELILADAETFKLPENNFDRILCCYSLRFPSNIRVNLSLWHSFLVSGGLLGLQVFAKTAGVAKSTLQKVLKRYGIKLKLRELTDMEEDKCYSLLQESGFKNIKVESDRHDNNYVALEEAQKTWGESLNHPILSSQFKQLSEEQLARSKEEYFDELKDLVTDKGILNDMIVYYVLGSK